MGLLDEQQKILKELYKKDNKKINELLSKEAEKWNSGQQRRTKVYTGDRGVKFLNSTNNVCAPPPIEACSDINEISTNGNACITWDGSSWESGLGVYSPACSKVELQKSDLNELLININVPSLESLIM